MEQLMVFEGHEVEIIVLNGQPYFNPYHVGDCLDISDVTVRRHLQGFNKKQVVKLTNSNVQNMNFRKLHNTGENFLTTPGVFKLIFKSQKPDAEKFQDWVTDDVLPAIAKDGYYETPKLKQRNERLASVNNTVKILTPLLEKAGCSSKIQLLTVKSIYEKAGINIPIQIEADQHYYDTTYIARTVGIRVKSSNKPADKAVNEIIRRLHIDESEYTVTWESVGGWQGDVKKYASSVIDKIKQWIVDNDFPQDIEYKQSNGDRKKYHVVYENVNVA